MEGVQGTYVQYVVGADQHLGRILALLPTSDPNFGILPPFFPVIDDFVLRSLDAVFGKYPQKMKGVYLSCLASLVYHSDFLRSNCQNRITSTALFTDPVRLEELKRRVACRLYQDGDPFLPTGLTNSVKIMGDVQQTKTMVTDLVSTVQGLVPTIASRTAEACRETLTQCAESFGNVTPDAVLRQVNEMREALTADLGNVLEEKFGRFALSARVQDVGSAPQQLGDKRAQVFPRDFVLPQGTLKVGFVIVQKTS